MIGFIKKLFGVTPETVPTPVVDTKVEAANQAPYKVDVPAPAVVEAAPAPKKKPAPKKQQYAKKAPAGKKPAPKKPAAPKAKPVK
jgi:hypothetical protein